MPCMEQVLTLNWVMQKHCSLSCWLKFQSVLSRSVSHKSIVGTYSHCSIPQICSHEDIERSHKMPHHAISRHHNLVPASQNLASLFRRIPPHITSPGNVRSIKPHPSSTRDGSQQLILCLAKRAEWDVKIQAGQRALFAVFVRGKRVDKVSFPASKVGASGAQDRRPL